MFAENWKISLRQITRLMILDLFGVSSLLLPGMLSGMTGADGVFCLLLGMAGGFVLLGLMQGILVQMKGSYYEYMKQTAGQLAGDIFMVFYLVYFITLAGYILYESTAMILTWLLPDGSYILVALLLLLFALYGTVRGIEGRARVYEILFWFLGIPLLFMLFLAALDVNPDYWTPIVWSSEQGFLKNSAAVWIFLLPLSGLLFLKPFCRKPERIAVCGKKALICVTILNAVIYLILTGTFGQHTVQVLRRPVITLMSMINLPGGFFSRQDVTMTAVWFFALFALLNTGVFQGTQILKEMCHEKNSNYSMWVVAVLVFLSGIGFFQSSVLTEIFEKYQVWIVLPGMLGILLLLKMIHEIKKWNGQRKGGKKQCGADMQD